MQILRTFPRKIAALNDILKFVREFMDQADIREENLFSIQFITEELFTNAVKYNPDACEDIRLTLSRNKQAWQLELVDCNVDPFDITKTAPVNTRQRLAERKVGGLGIHLVKQMVDEITYQYKNKCSIINVKKSLEQEDV